jgi:CheY-like chemotaxis protein
MLYIFIDDEAIFNLISKAKLQLLNTQTYALTFDSGDSALQYFEDNIQQLKHEKIVIFLDINMPEMNGFEFLQEYKNKFADVLNVVVYMLSSSIAEVDREAAQQYSMVKQFYSKPFQVSYLEGTGGFNG